MDGWPQNLRILTNFLVASPAPLVLLWGPDGIMIYNDGYAEICGARHPAALGAKVREVWPEAVDFNDNVMKVVLAGGTLAYRNQELTLYRNGHAEQVWLDLHYSPVMDESGHPAGVVAIVAETTAQVVSERRLAQSEERLQLALSGGSGIGTWDWDVPADRVVADARFAKLYGVDPAKAKAGAPLADFFAAMHPDDVAGVQQHIAGALAGKPFYAEYRLIQPDGGEKWVAAQGRCTLSDEGKPLRFPGVSFDITERVKAEARTRALLDLDDRFRKLDTPAELAFAAAETLGQTLNVSRAGYGTIDPVAETITIERDWNAPGIASLAGVLNFRDYGSYIEDLKRGETVVFADAELDPRTRDTADALKAISAQAVVNMPVTEQGGLVALLYLNHATARAWPQVDLDLVREVANRTRMAVERRRAEEDLRELNSELERKVVEQTLARGLTWRMTPDMMGVLDANGRFESSNPAWERVLGWTEDEMSRFTWRDLVHPDDVASSEKAWTEAAERGLPVIHFENRYRTKSNAWRWLQWVAMPESGKVYFTTRDVTAAKARQADLEVAQEALRQAQKMEAVGQLTGGIAHDFNNLLAGISGSLELIERRIAENRTAGLDRYITAAQASARRAASLTQRLLAFSRRQTLDPKPTDVNRLIAGMAELVRRTVGPAIPVEVVEAGGLWLTRIDPSQLENALLNLSINARDAMPEGGRITIETANKWLDDRAAKERELSPGQYISVCVTDSGTGMSPEVIDRAFDPFFTTKPIGQGTGLGLSMVHGFVRQSGGQVRIYSELNAGTTVCLYLPRFVGELDAVDAPHEDFPCEAGYGETVLVIDDEATIRMLMVEVLGEAGYRVLEAGDGPSGLKILNSDARIDLLITDVGLPGGINGRQVADAARGRRPDLKVLFITGYAENAVVGNGHLEPGMAVVTKPFEINALAGRVRDLIDS
jgi:PAS domain S-box-containing protein